MHSMNIAEGKISFQTEKCIAWYVLTIRLLLLLEYKNFN